MPTPTPARPAIWCFRRALGGMDVATATARAEAWRPYRAYAQFQLWTSAVYS